MKRIFNRTLTTIYEHPNELSYIEPIDVDKLVIKMLAERIIKINLS
jgi:hypothetical protein